MPKKKQGKEVSMRKVREILRLSLNQGLAQREVANSCNVSQSSVNKYFQQAQLARLSYEEVCGLDDLQLAKRLGIRTRSENHKVYPIPDFEYIHKEMKKKGVTLQLLWEEYKEEHPDGYQSSMFCILYRRWQKKLTPVLRQVHMAGEKLFVDYAGQTVPITNPKSGQVRQAQIFVGVLGCSNYTYAEATWTQGLEDWIASHVRCFEFMGGVPRVVVPDNLKSGVSKACFYEPEINPTYHELALHYGIAILPTRVRKPKDKAKVEAGVQVVERWILAALRNRVFFSPEELNEEIGRLLKRLNERAFKKLPGSRLTCFENPGEGCSRSPSRTSIYLRSMEKGQGQHRLPCGTGSTLLQRSLRAFERRGSSAIQRHNGRNLSPAPKGRLPSEGQEGGETFHPQRTHAQKPPKVSGMVALKNDSMGFNAGATYRELHRVSPGGKAIPRAGLPLLFRKSCVWPSAIPKNVWRPPASVPPFWAATVMEAWNRS